MVAAGLVSAVVPAAVGGPYSGPEETSHRIDPAIPADSSRFLEWASEIDPARTEFAPRGSNTIDVSGGFNSLGDLDATQTALGLRPGFLTVTFPTGIGNGAGHDFAVFENGFVVGENNLFAEFAFVEVSTNGTDFVRFPAVSTNTVAAVGSGAFAAFDVTNVHNLAGKHAVGFGTPFDLDDLTASAEVLSGQVDLASIQYLKLVDIPGSGEFLDAHGSPILDAWLTEGSGGFDFRLGDGLGVGVINVATVPEPSSVLLLLVPAAAVGSRYRRRSWPTP